MPSGTRWYPPVPTATQWCVCTAMPIGAQWESPVASGPVATPQPSPAVAARPLTLLLPVAADQRPDEKPEKAEEQEGAQDGAHDDARLPSSWHRSTSCHRRHPRRLPTGHCAPTGTLAHRASTRRHPAHPAPPPRRHLLGTGLMLTWHTE